MYIRIWMLSLLNFIHVIILNAFYPLCPPFPIVLVLKLKRTKKTHFFSQVGEVASLI